MQNAATICDGYFGTLTDDRIREYVRSGSLIPENYLAANVKQACYELRASDTYYDLTCVSKASSPVKHKVAPDGYILIKPRHFVTIVTLERLDLPANVLARILTKGTLFSIGVVPVNTYADPGFEGQLGIVLANMSSNYLRIRPFTAIAKIEFCRLQECVAAPYRGPHGYAHQHWPVPTEMILSGRDIECDDRIEHPLRELDGMIGSLTADAIRRVFRFERWMILATCAFVILASLALGYALMTQQHAALSQFLAVVTGVIASAAFALLTHLATYLRRRKAN